MSAIDQQFRLSASTCEEFGRHFESYTLHRIRTSVDYPRDFAAFLHDNPLGQFLVKPDCESILHLRDLVSLGTWSRTDHFNGIAKPTMFSDMLLLLADKRSGFKMVSLYRDQKFSATERHLAGLLQPHLHAAWKRVSAIERDVGAGPLRIELKADFSPFEITEPVRIKLKHYFPHWDEGSKLPGPLDSWVAHSLLELRRQPLLRPLRALSAEGIHGRLLFRCFPEKGGEVMTIVMVEVPSSPSFLRLRREGLTLRECEVMHWIAQGKRNLELATIIGLSPRTVGKHVENAFRKLSANTRTAAVAKAFELLGRG